MTKKHLTIPAVVAGALGMGSAIAWAAEPTADELMKQIEQLQAKVQQLEQKQKAAATQNDVDATVEKVLADAEKRSKLLQMEGFTAGWNDGFKIQSADGNFLLQPMFQFNGRYVVNFRDETPTSSDSDTQMGFEITYMKFGALGNVFTPDLTYNFRWNSGEAANRSSQFQPGASSSDSGDLVLENAYMQYFWSDDWAVRFGQWTDNWTHEETVETYNSLAVDRSLMNELIGGGLTQYIQGVAVMYQPQDSAWRAMGTYQDGLNTANTPFVQHSGGSTPVTAPAGVVFAPNFGFSGRFEWKFAGDWKAYDDFTAYRSKDDGVMVLGFGGVWTQDGSDDLYLFTADFQWKTGALGLYASLVGNTGTYDSVVGSDDTFDWGFNVQAGWMLTEKWEIFGRLDYTLLDDANLAAGGEDTFGEIGVGVNYYWHGQNAKFTLDCAFLPNGIPAGTNLPALDFLDSNEEFEFVVRAQMQLLL